MVKEMKDKTEGCNYTVVSGKDIALEALQRGKSTFTTDLLVAGKLLDKTINQAANFIRQAYTKDKDTSFAVCLEEHATICFSCADGKLNLACAVGTGKGIKQLCDMLPSWFQENYEVTDDGKSVNPREK